MLKIFLLIILTGVLIIMQISVFLIIALIISVIALLSSYGRYKNANEKTPSKMVCVNCGSTNVRIHNREEGWTAGGLGGAGFGLAGGNVRKNINRQHVVVCADCGFDSPYTTLAEIEEERKNAKSSIYCSWFFVILFSALLIFGASKMSANAEGIETPTTSAAVTEQYPG